jgi:hypothetical protein
MAFADNEKTDIRRFCGYEAYGTGPGGFSSWRFFQAWGLLEFRLSNLTPQEEAVVRTVYLSNLSDLESDIVGVRTNLDTDVAAVWTHNKQELKDRVDLYNYWRRELCHFLGVPPGDGVKGTSNTVRVVV